MPVEDANCLQGGIFEDDPLLDFDFPLDEFLTSEGLNLDGSECQAKPTFIFPPAQPREPVWSLPALGSLPNFGFAARHSTASTPADTAYQCLQSKPAEELVTPDGHSNDGVKSEESVSIHTSTAGFGKQHPKSAAGTKAAKTALQQKGPSTAALAQRRYHQRMKERRKDSEKQLDDMIKQMQMLEVEKSELAARNHFLQQTLQDWEQHQEMLFAREDVRDKMQTMLVDHMAKLMSRVRQKTVSADEVLNWTFNSWMTMHFQEYIDRLKLICNEAADARQTGVQDLETLVNMQYQSPPYQLYDSKRLQKDSHGELVDLMHSLDEREKARCLFSCYYWAVLSWNLGETLRCLQASPLPGKAFWSRTLAQLELSREQKAAILQARQRMLSKLQDIGKSRQEMVQQLGLDIISSGEDNIALLPSSSLLAGNMEAERFAVYAFLVAAVDEALTTMQLAKLDTLSYPWCPHVWQMYTILAEESGQSTEVNLQLQVDAPAIQLLLPRITAFDVLRIPVTGYGAGFQVKRGILMQTFYTTKPASCYQLPSQAVLDNLTLLEVHSSRWKMFAFWDWHIACSYMGKIIPNHIISDGRPADHLVLEDRWVRYLLNVQG